MEILSRSVVVEVVYLQGVSNDAGVCCSRCDVLIKFGLSVFNLMSVYACVNT